MSFLIPMKCLTYIMCALKGCVQEYYVIVPALHSRSDNNQYFRYQIEIIDHLKHHNKLMMIPFKMNVCTTRTITDRFESDLASNNWTILKSAANFKHLEIQSMVPPHFYLDSILNLIQMLQESKLQFLHQ